MVTSKEKDVFGSHGDPVNYCPNGVNFDRDSNECKEQISGRTDDVEQNLWQEVSITNRKNKERRKEDNVEGLVRKSKGFLPMNL